MTRCDPQNEYKHELRLCGYTSERISQHRPIVCIYNDEDRFNMLINFDSPAFSETLDKYLAGKMQRYDLQSDRQE